MRLLSVSSFLLSAWFTVVIDGLQCAEKLFPIYAGDSNNQTVNCFEFDETTGMIIFGGNTTSSDTDSKIKPSGFIYAVDLYGNWMWNVALKGDGN